MDLGKGRNQEGTPLWPFWDAQFLGLSVKHLRGIFDKWLSPCWGRRQGENTLKGSSRVGYMMTDWQMAGTFLPAPPQASSAEAYRGGWLSFYAPCPSVPCSGGRVTPHQPPIHPLWEGRVCVGHCPRNCSPSWGQRRVGGGGIKAGLERLLCPPRPWFSPWLHGRLGYPAQVTFTGSSNASLGAPNHPWVKVAHAACSLLPTA